MGGGLGCLGAGRPGAGRGRWADCGAGWARARSPAGGVHAAFARAAAASHAGIDGGLRGSLQTAPAHLLPPPRTIVFALSYFHAALLERKKFGVGNLPGATSGIGWNMNYPFNTGDLLCCGQTTVNYLENNAKVNPRGAACVRAAHGGLCRTCGAGSPPNTPKPLLPQRPRPAPRPAPPPRSRGTTCATSLGRSCTAGTSWRTGTGGWQTGEGARARGSSREHPRRPSQPRAGMGPRANLPTPPAPHPPTSKPLSYLSKYFNEPLLEGVEMFPGFPTPPNSMNQKQVGRGRQGAGAGRGTGARKADPTCRLAPGWPRGRGPSARPCPALPCPVPPPGNATLPPPPPLHPSTPPGA